MMFSAFDLLEEKPILKLTSQPIHKNIRPRQEKLVSKRLYSVFVFSLTAMMKSL